MQLTYGDELSPCPPHTPMLDKHISNFLKYIWGRKIKYIYDSLPEGTKTSVSWMVLTSDILTVFVLIIDGSEEEDLEQS